MSAEWIIYARPVLALIVVAGLILCIAGLAKKAGLDKKWMGNKKADAQLSLVETLYLDPKRRLVIVRSGAKEHVLLLGVSGDMLIETYEVNKAHA